MPDSVPGSSTSGRVIATGDARARTYELMLAIGALLVAFGIVGPDELQLWLNLGAALIPIAGLVIARLNVPRS